MDAFVIGTGFGGMYAIHRLRGMGLDVHAIEAGKDVGGTWYWNRYPGARCDVMSIDYSYSFSDAIQQEWTWTEQFAAQPEILAYANFVATTLDLRRSVNFETRAKKVVYDDARRLWVIETEAGAVFETTYLVMATGPLSAPKLLDIPGAHRFSGTIYQAQRWPHEAVDLDGKRVGVIGTGSTGIQIIPVVAKEAGHLHVFQRTPSFTLPMRNRSLEPDYVAQVKAHYPALRAIARNTFTGGVRPVSTRPLFSVTVEERNALMEDAWAKGGLTFLGLFSDLLTNQAANDIVADFVRDKIGEVVKDPATAEALKPRGYPIFARRPCLDTGYYEAYNRANVTLVDCLTDPIVAVTETGIRTQGGEVNLDVIIAATGYDGLTGAMLAIDIRGRDGLLLSEKWQDGSRSHLGLMMAGFPNLFIVAGANGPSALANFVLLNEQNVDWTCDCIAYLRANGLATIEPTVEAEDQWMHQVAALSSSSLMPKANTWYTGANIAGKPRVFSIYMGGLARYRETCAVAAQGYQDFVHEPKI
ncbi:flavin-containing monooxygenase [Sphingomonas sp. HMP9]|uniref:flavin-containing monooxygenase n=1 Tax=Sphingomonas sp. HMP9 TaxID=1517554 RepID=UPI001E4378A6|nr:NAD(P)/FAD-dependent oxidoreductase [Sphingomonas sp. HMP9]